MSGRTRNFQLFVAGSAFASLFLALVLAVAPQFHERMHHDDTTTGQHECAVTLVASGKYELGATPTLIAAPVVEWEKTPAQQSVWVPALFLGACVLEHAPPVFS